MGFRGYGEENPALGGHSTHRLHPAPLVEGEPSCCSLPRPAKRGRKQREKGQRRGMNPERGPGGKKQSPSEWEVTI